MFAALAEQTLDIPVPFQYSLSRVHRNYHGSGGGAANSGIVWQDSFKALNQSALMEEPQRSVRIWITWTAAPVPVLSTADRVTCHTVTWPTRLPVINKLLHLHNTSVVAPTIKASSYMCLVVQQLDT